MRAGAAAGAVVCAIAAMLVAACDTRPETGAPPPLAEAEPAGSGPPGFVERPGFGLEVQRSLDGSLDRFRVDLPENLWSPSRGFRFAPVLGEPDRAELLPHGYVAENASARVRGEWELAGDVVEMRLRVTNLGAAPVEDLRGNVCLQLHQAPSFRPEAARRVFFFHDGEPLEFSELAARDGYLASRVAVRGPGPPRGPVGIRGAGPLFSRSGVLADDGVIAVTTADGRWTLGTLWEDARAVFHNMLSGRQCIHSNPGFGDVAAGASVTRRGWMVLVEGGPREARRRLLALRDAAGPPPEPVP